MSFRERADVPTSTSRRSSRSSARVVLVTMVALVASLLGVPSTSPVDAQAGRVIYLTFDDGPVPQFTRPLLNALDQYDAKATFFYLGLRVNQNQALVADTLARGHALGNHTNSHPDLPSLTNAQIRTELNAANAAYVAATGEEPVCMRPPNGTTDQRVRDVALSLGLQTVLWDTGGNDYGLQDPQDFLDRVRGAQSGDIILLHDAAGQNSIDAARLVLEDFTDRGFRFETVPECRPGGTTPPTTTTTTTQPPATQPPATQPPATQPPATQPPVTQPPATQPPDNRPAITVRAKGDIGNERIELRLNRNTVASFNVSTSFQDFNFTPSSPITINQLRVHFVNNAQDALGDRNVDIDYVEVNNRRYQTEDPSVESIGSYRSSDGCRRGFKQSQRLACSGRFEYAVPNGTVIGGGGTPTPTTQPPPGGAIQVVAKGDTGSETIQLEVNGTIVQSWSLGQNFATFSYEPTGAVNGVRVWFINDGQTPSGNRNAEIDYIVVDGTRYESEAASTESRGSWTPATGCSRGFKQSQRLACNGWFRYSL